MHRLTTGKIARLAASHPWLTVALWLVLVTASLATTAMLLPGQLTSDDRVTVATESSRAHDLLDRHMPQIARAQALVIVRSPGLRATDRRFRTALARVLRGVAEGPLPPLTSADGHAIMVMVDDEPEVVATLNPRVTRLDGSRRFDVGLFATSQIEDDFSAAAERDLRRGEAIGIVAGLVVLLFVFGAAAAAALPLLLGLTTMAVALALVSLVAHEVELSVYVTNIVFGVGLALGIDYSLFMISRYREERAGGRLPAEAIEQAGVHAGRAVLFSGLAAALALLGLLLVPENTLRSLGLGAVLAAAVAVLVALTLLPALLGLLGDRVNRFALPGVGERVLEAGDSRFWASVSAKVTRRPLVALLASLAVLLAAAAPVLTLHSGRLGVRALPENTLSRHTLALLEASFPQGARSPSEIAIEGDVESPSIRAGIDRLQTLLVADPDFGPSQLELASDHRLALVRVISDFDPLSERARGAIERLRSRTIPTAFGDSSARVLVGGSPAVSVDYVNETNGALLPVALYVLAISFVLLLVAFRSLVVPLKAIVLNLLSVSAAWGLLVLVFQHGVGAGVLGVTKSGTIEVWVPVFTFCILFALSMDYHVLLLSRIQERFLATGDNSRAVAEGLTSTARIITGAALVIVVVFSGFAFGDVVMLQQLGFGVAIALLLDATLIRSVLLPATMTLLGEANWYLPRWLPLGEARDQR